MNRIQRIAAAAAVGTAVLVPATAAMAGAEPYPWHNSDDTRSSVVNLPKAQIERDELLPPGPEAPPVQPASNESGFPWDTVGLLTLGVGAVAVGGVAVARRRREPRLA
jgi:hypothetical protein